MKHFLSFYSVIYYTQQAFVFRLLVDFCIAQDHVVVFFVSSLERL